MNPYIILAAVLAVIGAFGGGYWWGASAKENAILAEQKREDDLIAKMQGTVADSISKMTVKHVTIRQQVDHEIIEKPVYRDCMHTDDGLRLVNSALSNTEPAGPSELPAIDAPDR